MFVGVDCNPRVTELETKDYFKITYEYLINFEVEKISTFTKSFGETMFLSNTIISCIVKKKRSEINLNAAEQNP